MKVFLLLDRSGSMYSNWVEVIGSINTYARGITVEDAELYVAAFDSGGYDVVRNCRNDSWDDITPTEIQPRGMTPLYDSFMRMAHEAELNNDPSTVLVVMTDGAENSSREFTQHHVKDRVVSLESRKWPVVFLGADFSKEQVLGAYSNVMSADTLRNTRATTKGMYNTSLSTLAGQTMAYASAVGGQSLNAFNMDEDTE